MAARAGHGEAVLLIVQTHGVNKDKEDNDGHTPLGYALHNGRIDVVASRFRLVAETIIEKERYTVLVHYPGSQRDTIYITV